MKTSTTLILSEGKNLNYLIPVLLCGIASAIGFIFFFPLGILLAIAAVLLGIIESGLEFNTETMEFRRFKSLPGFSWGKWVKIPDPDSFHLRLSVESHSYRTPMMSSPAYYGRGSKVQSKSITYDIKVHTKTDQWIDIYEFSSYKMALQLAKKLRELESFEVTDHIALKLEENQQKRMNKRR